MWTNPMTDGWERTKWSTSKPNFKLISRLRASYSSHVFVNNFSGRRERQSSSPFNITLRRFKIASDRSCASFSSTESSVRLIFFCRCEMDKCTLVSIEKSHVSVKCSISFEWHYLCVSHCLLPAWAGTQLGEIVAQKNRFRIHHIHAI